MIRIGGVLALLASLGLSGLLSLCIRQERYAGPVEYVREDGEYTFEVVESPEPLVTGLISLRALPTTLPAALEAELRGIKSREWIGLQLKLPVELRPFAVKGAPVELRHRFLELPLAGAIAGRTTVKVGSAEWHTSSWPLWGALSALASAPLLLWGLAVLPARLFRKRNLSPGRLPHG